MNCTSKAASCTLSWYSSCLSAVLALNCARRCCLAGFFFAEALDRERLEARVALLVPPFLVGRFLAMGLPDVACEEARADDCLVLSERDRGTAILIRLKEKAG